MKSGTFRKLFDLRGRSAIVTGGAGFLGKQFCAGLAEFGANVAVVDIAGKEAKALAAGLSRDFGVKAVGIGCDISDAQSVRKMVKHAKESLGPITILHNNAAWKSSNPDKFFEPVGSYSLKTWREIMSVNVDGMFLTAQAVGNLMSAQGFGGSIVQTASVYGLMAPDQRIYENSSYCGRPINTPAVYTVSKSAVIGLTRHLASLWAAEKIRVNTLTPGGVESGQNKTFVKKYSNRVPLGRMAKADEMVGALIYLASDASRYVTGQNLIVDGGLSVW